MKKLQSTLGRKAFSILSSLALVLVVTLGSCSKDDNTAGPQTVLVKFDTDGGSDVESQEIEKGGEVSPVENPTKEGFEFVKWTLNGEAFVFDLSEITSDITLVAEWRTTSFETKDIEGGVAITAYIGEDVAVVIPSMIAGKKVLAIEPKAGANLFGTVLADGLRESTIISVDMSNAEFLTEIGENSFMSMKTLTNVTFSPNLEIIGDAAFHFSDNIVDISLPASVTLIGKFGLSIGKLTTITIEGGDSVIEIGKKTFDSLCPLVRGNKSARVFCPASLLKAYKSSWGSYVNRSDASTFWVAK